MKIMFYKQIVPVITVNSLKTADVSIGEGNTFNVSWTNTGKFDNVDIEIVNGSGYTSTVAENVPNNGSYSWTIPSNMTLNKAKLRIGVAETGKYYTETDISSLSSLSNKGLTIINSKIGLDDIIDENGIELTDYEKGFIKSTANYYANREYIKDISSSSPSQSQSSKKTNFSRFDIGDVPDPWEYHCIINPTDTLCDDDPTNDGDGGIKEITDDDGNTIIVNTESDYDLQIVYKRASDDDLKFKLDIDLNGVTHVYYNVWLRNAPDSETGEYELIHEELMRTSYETETKTKTVVHTINDEEITEVYADMDLQRTKVELTFFYDKAKTAEDIEWNEIPNMKAETIWGFYHEKIFNSYEFPNHYSTEEIPILEEIDGKANAYYLYKNSYDERLTAKTFIPNARWDWNKLRIKNGKTPLFNENDLSVDIIYYQNDVELTRIKFNLQDNKDGNMPTLIETNGIKYIGSFCLTNDTKFIDFNNFITKKDNRNITRDAGQYTAGTPQEIIDLVNYYIGIGVEAAKKFYPLVMEVGSFTTKPGVIRVDANGTIILENKFSFGIIPLDDWQETYAWVNEKDWSSYLGCGELVQASTEVCKTVHYTAQIRVDVKREVKDGKTIETVKMNFLQTMEVSSGVHIPKESVIGMKVVRDKFGVVISQEVISVSIKVGDNTYLNMVKNKDGDWNWYYSPIPYDPLTFNIEQIMETYRKSKAKTRNVHYGTIYKDRIEHKTAWKNEAYKGH